MTIKIKDLTKAYGQQCIYKNFNLTLEENKITGIMGPSGSGKTTLLNLLAGIILPDEGCIQGIKAGKTAYIFQEDRLLPWRTVRQNIEFILEKENPQKVEAVLEMVGLLDHQNQYPKTLSGGMRQRVSIARAFCYPAELLLMDEPFSSLDSTLKDNLTEDFKNLWQQDPKTILYVSHNGEELKKLCSTVYLLEGQPVVPKKII